MHNQSRLRKIEAEVDEASPRHHMLWMNKLRATPSRLALLGALESEPHPVSAVQIKNKLESSRSGGSGRSSRSIKASVYRGLETLVETGLVKRINTGSVEATYEIDFGRKHHHHIVCTRCGDIEDISYCPAKRISEDLLAETKKFHSIMSHSLEYFGMCNKCTNSS